MRRYTVRRVVGAIPLTGRVSGTAWEHACVLRIDRYPWYERGRRQSTTVRLLCSGATLFVQFRCRDRHSSARETKLNGDVYLDSCVELFAMPRPAAGDAYFNLEINCCGCMHLGWGAGRPDRRLATPEIARRIPIATSVPAPTKDESHDDRTWWVAVALPFAALSDFAGMPIRPRPGAAWGANLYRCGGQTDPQYACWNPIDWPRPDYHRPEFFGRLRFG